MNPCFFQDMYILKINSLVKKNEFRKKMQLQPYCAEPTKPEYCGQTSSIKGKVYWSRLTNMNTVVKQAVSKVRYTGVD